MREQDEQLLKLIKEEVTRRIDHKYRLGAEEHGGHIGDKPCSDLDFDELIDGIVYKVVDKLQKSKAISMLKEIIKGVPQTNDIVKVINLLECGNVDGVKYDD